jgi:hypothetical protein
MILTTLLAAGLATATAGQASDADWAADPVWYDGLVEKATYTATREIYGRDREYEAVFLTNKEQHAIDTLTKATGSGAITAEVWKHNQIEVIPTPNYDYKFVATSHLTTEGLGLTRLDVSEQEFCGTSFKQYQADGENAWDFFQFSYMPGSGRVEAMVETDDDKPTVAFNALPLWLRDFDFQTGGEVDFYLLPDQKSNRTTPHEPVDATARMVGTSDEGHQIVVTAGNQPLGLFTMATDRLHVMVSFESNDGRQTYELKSLQRTDYWTTNGR